MLNSTFLIHTDDLGETERQNLFQLLSTTTVHLTGSSLLSLSSVLRLVVSVVLKLLQLDDLIKS